MVLIHNTMVEMRVPSEQKEEFQRHIIYINICVYVKININRLYKWLQVIVQLCSTFTITMV